jgi:ATP-binding cassette subfamily B protein
MTVGARVRIARLLWETSRPLAVTLGVYVLVDGTLPVLALVALGHAVGKIPAAITGGLGSPSGRALLLALAIGTGAYCLSLLRGPAESLLSAYCDAVMSAGTQRRLARAVCEPAGIEHLEDPEVLDQLASASGELATSAPADAPFALASALGSRLSGVLACAVLASFRWWVGVFFLAGWLLIRPPLLKLLTERAVLARRAVPALRHSWWYLGASYRPAFAKELRMFGLGDWMLGRHASMWLAGMAAPWRHMWLMRRRVLGFAVVVAAMYAAGAGALALAAYRGEVGVGTLAVMLPMLPTTMQAGGVSAADVTLEQMLAAVPDMDAVLNGLAPASASVPALPARNVSAATVAETETETDAAEHAIRFEDVSYTYPTGDAPVLDGLDLELKAGESLAIVGVNGAGKTTLVTLLARLRDPTRGRITVGGTDLRDLDARSWQRRVAVVYQDYTKYPLTARENVGLRDLGGDIDERALEDAARRAGALDVIAKLPAGWDTICAPGYAGGTDLSGGQWQRLALARALYAVARGARVLVLDEPTAQLDIRAEAAFYEQFLDLTRGLTTVVISHRFATVRQANRIAVLDSGRITELGRHDELVAAGGSYAELFALQAARFA